MHTGAMNWKERQKFESGITHGIAIAMLSAGMGELAIDGKHSLWSYTHQLSVEHGADGSAVYRIKDREQTKP